MKKKVSTFSIDASRRTATYRSAASRGVQSMMIMTLLGVAVFAGITIFCVVIAQDASRLPHVNQFETFDLINSWLDAAAAYGRFVTERTGEFAWGLIRAIPIVAIILGVISYLHVSFSSTD